MNKKDKKVTQKIIQKKRNNLSKHKFKKRKIWKIKQFSSKKKRRE